VVEVLCRHEDIWSNKMSLPWLSPPPPDPCKLWLISILWGEGHSSSSKWWSGGFWLFLSLPFLQNNDFMALLRLGLSKFSSVLRAKLDWWLNQKSQIRDKTRNFKCEALIWLGLLTFEWVTKTNFVSPWNYDSYYCGTLTLSFLFVYLFWWDWSLNSGLHAAKQAP
jgi:hypothetical protein